MKKNWKMVIASSFALICTVAASVAAIATNGFALFGNTVQEQTAHNNQLFFGNFFGNGITLTASAEDVTTGTPVFKSVVSDAGDISALTVVNTASVPFAYKDLTLYENQTVVKIGVPIKTVINYTTDSLFTVYVVSYDEPLTTFTQVSEYKLTIPANTFSSNTVNDWYYFDTNIAVGENQTLAFTSSNDTIRWGFRSSSSTQYALYNKLFSGYSDSAYGFFDVYTSDGSTTPSTPSIPSLDDSFKGWTTYPYIMQAGYYDVSNGSLVETGEYYCTNWIDRSIGDLSTDFQLKVDIKHGYAWTLIVENVDGTYDTIGLVDHTTSESLPGNIFNSFTTRFAISVRKSDSYTGSTSLTLEEAKEALTISVPYRHSYKLAATVNADATDKSVTWSAAWVDGTTTNIDAYVILEVAGEDGLSVTLRNIQAFDKQIIVKVTSNSNPDISAQCTIDYVKRLQDINVSFGSNGKTIALGASTLVTTSPKYSKGTLDGTLEYSMEFALTSEFVQALQGSKDYISACTAELATIPVNNSRITITSSQSAFEFTVAKVFGSYTQPVCDVLLHNAIHNTANEFEEAGKVIGTVRITGIYTHSSGYTKNYTYTINLMAIDSSAQSSAVTDITLDNTTLVF